MPLVRGIIRHRETAKFYAGSGKWTDERSDALQFRSLSEVVAEAQTYRLLNDSCEFMVYMADCSDAFISFPL